MKTIDVRHATGTLADYARALGEEPVVLTDEGQPIAALLPIDEDDLASFALATNPRFFEILEQSRAEDRAGLSLPEAEVRRELGL